MFFYFWKIKKNTGQRAKLICALYGDGTIAETEGIVYKSFARSKSGHFDLADWECSGWPEVVDDDKIKSTIENNQLSWQGGIP